MAIATAASGTSALRPPVLSACAADSCCCCCDSSLCSGYGEVGFSGRQWSARLRNWRSFKVRNPGHLRTRGYRLVISAAARGSLYDTLGVTPSATEKEIKQAYRKLALKYHPDVNKEAGAQDKFLEIKQAYQTLVDVQSRAKFDASRKASTSWEPFSWNSETGRSQSRTRTAPLEDFYGLGEFFKDLQTSFDDFFRDLQSDLKNNRPQGRPKSLWEELADFGEEFVEFLEKELNVIDNSGNYKEPPKQTKSNDFEQADRWKDTKGAKAADKGKSAVETELEEMLAELKEELGL